MLKLLIPRKKIKLSKKWQEKKGTLPCLNVGEERVELYGKNGDFFLKFLN